MVTRPLRRGCIHSGGLDPIVRPGARAVTPTKWITSISQNAKPILPRNFATAQSFPAGSRLPRCRRRATFFRASPHEQGKIEGMPLFGEGGLPAICSKMKEIELVTERLGRARRGKYQDSGLTALEYAVVPPGQLFLRSQPDQPRLLIPMKRRWMRGGYRFIRAGQDHRQDNVPCPWSAGEARRTEHCA